MLLRNQSLLLRIRFCLRHQSVTPFLNGAAPPKKTDPAFGQYRSRAKKAASSEKSSERATFLDALSLLSYKLEPGKG